jgi:hypothetical protein
MENSSLGGDKLCFYLEDLRVGQRFVSDTHRIDEEQIRVFAKQFDPSRFTSTRRPRRQRSLKGW